MDVWRTGWPSAILAGTVRTVCTQCQREFEGELDVCDQDGQRLLPVLTEYSADESSIRGHVLGGRYVISGVLGSGGMGIVLRAHHVFLGRDVAVKLLHPELLMVKEVKQRFMREARTQSAIRDEHIVEISDFGVTPQGLHYLVMEFLQGCDLLDYLTEQGPLDVPTMLEVGVQVCRALTVIHGHGIVHRDLKPENIWMVGGVGATIISTKVLDFGIAGLMADGEGENTRLTRTGKTLGTPHYMAPEQGRGGQIDGRTDLYSLGCILFELLTGRPCFEGNSPLDILTKHILEEARPPSALRPGLPPWMDGLILRCLAKNADERWPDAAALGQELERRLGGASDTDGWAVTRVPSTVEVMDTAHALDAPAADQLELAATEFALDAPRTTTAAIGSAAAPTESLPHPSRGKGRALAWTALALSAAAAIAIAIAVWPRPEAPAPAEQAAAPPVVKPEAQRPPVAPAAAPTVVAAPAPLPVERREAESEDGRRGRRMWAIPTLDPMTGSPAAAEPSVTRLEFDIRPPGVTIVRVEGDKTTVLGASPKTITVPRSDAKVTYRFQLAGHDSATNVLSHATDSLVRLNLSPTAAVPPAPSKRKPKGKTAPRRKPKKPKPKVAPAPGLKGMD